MSHGGTTVLRGPIIQTDKVPERGPTFGLALPSAGLARGWGWGRSGWGEAWAPGDPHCLGPGGSPSSWRRRRTPGSCPWLPTDQLVLILGEPQTSGACFLICKMKAEDWAPCPCGASSSLTVMLAASAASLSAQRGVVPSRPSRKDCWLKEITAVWPVSPQNSYEGEGSLGCSPRKSTPEASAPAHTPPELPGSREAAGQPIPSVVPLPSAPPTSGPAFCEDRGSSLTTHIHSPSHCKN